MNEPGEDEKMMLELFEWVHRWKNRRPAIAVIGALQSAQWHLCNEAKAAILDDEESAETGDASVKRKPGE